jgi:hypothetical protein
MQSLTRRKRMDVMILIYMHGLNRRRLIYLSPCVVVYSSLLSFFVDQLPIYLDKLVVVTSSVYNVTELSDQLVLRQFFLISPLLPVLTSSAESLLSAELNMEGKKLVVPRKSTIQPVELSSASSWSIARTPRCFLIWV